ncbi:hypothetical protein [Shewanella oncorhynchi]|uniref:hypothetical protein n=1 Tax=Shewanella oncorhynchi TaxID=2726434 RepID=UPI002E7B1D79|nr:hypothetical protein [Shewanella oncorhynchi]WVI91422.1 hypothetical protein VR487_11210 [Shewanella oncorhynchi]
MTPYAKRLLKYAIANCPVRPVRKGKTKAELLADRELWAVNYLNFWLGDGWQQLKSQPKAIKIVSSATTDEDDEC